MISNHQAMAIGELTLFSPHITIATTNSRITRTNYVQLNILSMFARNYHIMSIIELLIQNWEIVLLFFTIAVLYSSVGFGGGSSYLAVLALTALSFTEIRATALICNIVVVSNSFYLYHKEKAYNFKKIIPLVSASVPMAFIGGFLKIEEAFFYILLGITLLIASAIMLTTKKENPIENEATSKKHTFIKSLSYGSSIGFISGMVGIGGGIFLAPLLHITKWDTSKKIAATASLFILVNSVSGLTGQLLNPNFSIHLKLTLVLACIVFIGGQIGTRIGIHIIKPLALKRGTAILIAFVAVKILWKYLN